MIKEPTKSERAAAKKTTATSPPKVAEMVAGVPELSCSESNNGQMGSGKRGAGACRRQRATTSPQAESMSRRALASNAGAVRMVTAVRLIRRRWAPHSGVGSNITCVG